MYGIAGLRGPGRRLERDHRRRWSLRLLLSFALLTGHIGAPGAAYGLDLEICTHGLGLEICTLPCGRPWPATPGPCPAGRQRTATEVRFR